MGHCLFMRKGETHTAPLSGILASDLAVGSTVKLMEGGVATEYLVVNQGKPSGGSLYDDSCDGTWLLRKDVKEKRAYDSSNSNQYETSEVDTWLNGDFFNMFGSVEQASIKKVKIPYRAGGGYNGTDKSGSDGLLRGIFLLSFREVGWDETSSPNCPIDGSTLYYFSGASLEDEKRIATFNGNAVTWVLRTPQQNYSAYVKAVYGNGQGAEGWELASTSNGIRPALILPSTALFDTNTLILKGVA